MAHLQEKGTGLGGKFIKTFAPGSSEHLSVKKLDELILAFNALVVHFNAFLAHVDTGNVVGIGNTNVANFAGSSVSKTASDQLVQSPPKTNL